ncbi:MAG: hypothetical protein ABI882_12830 [Acidobacteriota bacterium]
MSLISVFLSLAVSVSPTASLESKDPTYFTYNIAEPNLQGIRLLDTFSVDERDHSTVSGDSGIIYEPCPKGWKCLPMEWFDFSVPEKCSRADSTASWVFKERKFTVAEALASQGFDKGRKIYVIDITNTDGSRYGTATYSEEHGLESMARVNTLGAFPKLQTYYLASDRGAAFGGCMPRGISTDRRHWRPNSAPTK